MADQNRITVELSGEDKVEGKIESEAERIVRDLVGGLYQKGHEVRTLSMSRTPVDTGTLRSTHNVTEPKKEGDSYVVEVNVGGPAAPYAVTVHEDLTAHHNVGQAKFLESALFEIAGQLGIHLAASVKKS